MSDFKKWFIDQFQFAGWLPLESSDLSRGATLAWNHQQKRIDKLEAAVRKHKAEIHEKMSFKKFPSHCIEDMKLWEVIE